MTDIETFALLTCAAILLIAGLIVTYILYCDRQHWRMRAIEAETMQGLLQDEVDYLRNRNPAPLKLVRK